MDLDAVTIKFAFNNNFLPMKLDKGKLHIWKYKIHIETTLNVIQPTEDSIILQIIDSANILKSLFPYVQKRTC